MMRFKCYGEVQLSKIEYYRQIFTEYGLNEIEVEEYARALSGLYTAGNDSDSLREIIDDVLCLDYERFSVARRRLNRNGEANGAD
jgi:hypothetical protein